MPPFSTRVLCSEPLAFITRRLTDLLARLQRDNAMRELSGLQVGELSE
jgi:hypothetical protein